MSYSDKKTTTQEILPPIPEEIRNEFRKVLKVQTCSDNEHEMHYYLTRWLDRKKLYWKYDVAGNIIVTKGQAIWYPCVVAHMDTVHDIMPELKLYYTKTGDDHDVMYAKCGNKKTGIGGDDKCGIYSVLYLLEKLDVVKAVFFTKEETGCHGSGVIDLSLLDDVGYVIQLDRWGRKDFICKDSDYDFVSGDFQEKIKSLKSQYGYEDTTGLVTDATKLFRRDIGVSCVNISCGYYQHHSDSEKIDLNQYWNALLFTHDMITTLGCNLYEKERVMKPRAAVNDSYDGEDGWGRGSYYGAGYWNNHMDAKKSYNEGWNDASLPARRTEDYYTPRNTVGFKRLGNDELDELSDDELNQYILSFETQKPDTMEWVEQRLLHAEYNFNKDDIDYDSVDIDGLKNVLNWLGLDVMDENSFDDLNEEMKDNIGVEYYMWCKGFLYDFVSERVYGKTKLEKNENYGAF